MEKLPINLLGITITTDENTSYAANFQNRIESIRTLTKIWSNRNLTAKGKITIINLSLIHI